MSRTAGFPSEKPRSASSSCIDETPRSKRMPSSDGISQPVEDATEIAKVRVHEAQSRVGKLLRNRNRSRVGVQCDQTSVPEPLQDRPCMAARPEGCVDVDSAGKNRQDIRAPAPGARERGSA